MIYVIKNKVNGMEYVGTAKKAQSRMNQHRSYLRRNIHPNYVLQEDWNIYGEPNFEFIDLGIGGETEELQYQINMNTIHPFGYNLKKGNANGKPSNISKSKNRESSVGRKWTDKQKAKLNNKGKNNPMFGRKQSEETKKKISESQKRRFSIQEGVDSHS